MSSGAILEGVLAINKPPAISSAQVIRDVEEHFNPSKLFRPWMAREQARRDAESHNQKRKRKWRGKRETSVKMGHGGTLDPMATGVLILGVGSGTKQLGRFTTDCTKSYEAVVLFGAATDSYDTEGKIVGRKPFEHITRDMVEKTLERFKGKGMQKPPIFSALRVQGKRLYEYAREGKEVPGEIKERPVEVHELEMMEWMEGGTHKWHWPEREAEKETKQIAEKMLHVGSETLGTDTTEQTDAGGAAKRRRDDALEAQPEIANSETSTKKARLEETADTQGRATQSSREQYADETPAAALLRNEEVQPSQDENRDARPEASAVEASTTDRPPCAAPACRIRMTVTSGFYVRSLCHDLGAALESLGIMASLVRTRQGDFVLGTNVLRYDDLKQGEDIWGPKVKQMLESWVDKEG